MCPRKPQCFIRSPEVALAHLRELRSDPLDADVLTDAAWVIKEITQRMEAHRGLVRHAQVTAQSLRQLGTKSPAMFSDYIRKLDSFFAPVTVGSTGTMCLQLRFNPHTLALEMDYELSDGSDRRHQSRKVKGPDLTFDYGPWHARILHGRTCPLVGDSPSARPSGPTAAGRSPPASPSVTARRATPFEWDDPLEEFRSPLLDSVLMHLMWRATQRQGDEPLALKVMMPAFVCCVSEMLGIRQPTPIHWALIEVAAGIASPCSHTPHGEASECKVAYEKSIDRWEHRITTKVRRQMMWLTGTPRSADSAPVARPSR